MTDFTSIEISADQGMPVELFDLAMGTEHWYLTGAGYDITYLYHTYESAPCKCAELSQSSEGGSDDMELEIPRGHALAVMCVAGAPDMQVSLTIYHGHDPYYHKYYTGYLNNFKFNANSIPCLIFGSASSDMPMKGGRRRAMKQCDLKLYGYRCGVNKTAHEITGTIDTISGVTITSTAFGAVATSTPAVYGDLTALPGCTYLESSYNGTQNAAKIFDNIGGSSYWHSSASAPQWFYCKWAIAQTIKKIRIKPQGSQSHIRIPLDYTSNIRYFRVQGSNNGSAWTNIDAAEFDGDCQAYTGEGGNDTEILEFDDVSKWISITLNNTTSYTYYRIYIYAGWGASTLWCSECEMIEADNSMDVHQFGAGGSIKVGNAERAIINHNGDTIIINRPFRTNVAAGDSFMAYRGCDHSEAVCREVFNNIINDGGRRKMPVKNPYTGRGSLVT